MKNKNNKGAPNLLPFVFNVTSHSHAHSLKNVSLFYTVHSESHCALRLRYIDLLVSIEVAVEVCCCCVTFHCIQLLNSG
jgi:hypothetical protein